MSGEALLPVRLQLFASVVLLLFLGWVVKLIRRHQLSLRDSLSWLLSTLVALGCVIFPTTLRWAADVLQVEVASNAIFALAFVYVLFNLLSSTLAISNGANRIRRLTQECALLRAELELLRKSVKVERGGEER
jgi:hypothetical protein